MRYGARLDTLPTLYIPTPDSLDYVDSEPEDEGDDDEHVANGTKGNFLPSPSLGPRHKHRTNVKSISAPRYRRRWIVIGSVACFILFWIAVAHRQPARPMVEENTGKAVVMATYRAQDLSWTTQIPPDWKIYRYDLDDPNPHHAHSIPRNQGREATAYLTFIIENYHALPNYTVFIHGHHTAWHQIEPMSAKISALNLTALDNDKYISLRCSSDPGCSPTTLIDFNNLWWGPIGYLPDFWNLAMPDEPMPSYIGARCCGQFAVSKEAILSRSLDFWLNFRTPLTADLSEFNATWGGNRTHFGVNKYSLGMMYEWTWHIVFGMDSVHCATEDYCRRVQFSDAILCDRYPGLWVNSAGWRNISCDFDFENGIHDSIYDGDKMLDSQALMEAVPPDMGKQNQTNVLPTTEEEEDTLIDEKLIGADHGA